jgi:hypothetical protein
MDILLRTALPRQSAVRLHNEAHYASHCSGYRLCLFLVTLLPWCNKGPRQGGHLKEISEIDNGGQHKKESKGVEGLAVNSYKYLYRQLQIRWTSAK